MKLCKYLESYLSDFLNDIIICSHIMCGICSNSSNMHYVYNPLQGPSHSFWLQKPDGLKNQKHLLQLDISQHSGLQKYVLCSKLLWQWVCVCVWVISRTTKVAWKQLVSNRHKIILQTGPVWPHSGIWMRLHKIISHNWPRSIDSSAVIENIQTLARKVVPL